MSAKQPDLEAFAQAAGAAGTRAVRVFVPGTKGEQPRQYDLRRDAPESPEAAALDAPTEALDEAQMARREAALLAERAARLSEQAQAIANAERLAKLEEQHGEMRALLEQIVEGQALIVDTLRRPVVAKYDDKGRVIEARRLP